MAKAKYKKWLTAEGQRQIEDWAAVSTDEELAAKMCVSVSTYYKWLKDYSEISEAVTRARAGAQGAAAVEAVEQSLYSRCLGGAFPVRKGHKVREIEYDDRGRKVRETERIELVEETTYVPADTNAIKFFLTNRAPEKWRNKTELSGDLNLGASVEEYLQGLPEGGREF